MRDVVCPYSFHESQALNNSIMRKPGGKVVWNFPRSLSSAVMLRTRRMRSSTLSSPKLHLTHHSLDESPKMSIPHCPHVSEGENCQGPSRTKVIKFRFFSMEHNTDFISHLFHFLSVHKSTSKCGRPFRAWCVKC